MMGVLKARVGGSWVEIGGTGPPGATGPAGPAGAAGTSWLAPFTAPSLAAFAWVNQGGATAVEANSRITLTCPAFNGENVRLLKQALPASPPWTVTACGIPLIRFEGYPNTGLMLRESATGKLSGLASSYREATNLHALRGYRWTSPTTYGPSDVFPALTVPHQAPLWLRLSRSGSTLSGAVSFDGYAWLAVYSEAVTLTFTTAPNEVGFYGDAIHATTPVTFVLLSWAVT